MQERVKRVLDSLAKADQLSASVVLKEAHNPSSPLHSCFDWDDTEAAKKYRLGQARSLIREYKISVVTIRHEPTPQKVNVQTRKYVHTPVVANGEGKYRPRENVVANPVSRKALVEQILARIDQVLNGNSDLVELTPIVKAMAEIRANMRQRAVA